MKSIGNLLETPVSHVPTFWDRVRICKNILPHGFKRHGVEVMEGESCGGYVGTSVLGDKVCSGFCMENGQSGMIWDHQCVPRDNKLISTGEIE